MDLVPRGGFADILGFDFVAAFNGQHRGICFASAAGRVSLGGLFFFMLAQVHELVHGFQHTEQNECQNDKVNDGRDECTDAQVDVKRQVQHNITEICLEQNANDGVDDVVR